MKKSFTSLNTRIEEMKNEDSDLINSYDEGEEKSKFQFEEIYWFQGVDQTTVVVQRQAEEVGMRAQGKLRAHGNYKTGRARK